VISNGIEPRKVKGHEVDEVFIFNGISEAEKCEVELL